MEEGMEDQGEFWRKEEGIGEIMNNKTIEEKVKIIEGKQYNKKGKGKN